MKIKADIFFPVPQKVCVCLHLFLHDGACPGGPPGGLPLQRAAGRGPGQRLPHPPLERVPGPGQGDLHNYLQKNH